MQPLTRPINVTAANFESEVLHSDIPVVMDFWAPWCGPCRLIGPVLEKLAATHSGSVKVAKINVDEEPELASAFQVRGIPTLYTMRDGKVAGHVVGFHGADALNRMFADLAAPSARPTAD